jgi:hypothetical protein
MMIIIIVNVIMLTMMPKLILYGEIGDDRNDAGGG